MTARGSDEYESLFTKQYSDAKIDDVVNNWRICSKSGGISP